MANAGVTFEFAAESAKLRSEIDKVRKELGSLNASAKGIKDGFALAGKAVVGAFSIGAIGGFLSKVNATADGLNDLAGRLGVSASGLQSLQLAAGLAGGSAEAVNTALGKMSTTLGDALAGNKQATESFVRLGLSAQQLAAMKPDEAFRLINQRLSEIPNTFERASAAQDIYGKGSRELAGLFAEGDAAIRGVEASLEQMGARLSDLDVAKIGVMNDELQFQQTVVTNLGTKFLSGLAPSVGVATGAVAEMLGRMGGATEAGKLFGTVMVGAIKIVETAAYGLAATFETVRAVISGMLAVIADGIGSVLGGVASTAEFFGLQIAGPIRNAANLMDGIGASLQNVSDQARENAVQAASYAIEAATNIVKAGEIFAAAEADYGAKAAAAAARNAAGQGAGSGYVAPGADPKASKDTSAADEERLAKAALGQFGRESLLLNDPLSDPRFLLEQQVGQALNELAAQQGAERFALVDQTNRGILDSFLLNNDMMIAAEQAKNMTLGDMGNNLAAMAMQQGGTLGKIGKAYAIAQTIWSTYTAVMKAMAEVPFPANYAVAAATAAMGVAQLAKIKSTNLGGSGSVAKPSAGGVPTSSAALRDATPAGTQAGESAQQKSAVTIVVQGNLVETGSTATWLASVLGEAINDRDMVFINSNSRQAMELAGA